MLTETEPRSSDKSLALCIPGTALVALGVAWLIVRVCLGRGGLQLPAMTASTGFVLVALFAGGLRTGYGRLVLAGLCFCWLGDYFGASDFVDGALAFCAAHIAFSLAFLVSGVRFRDWARGLPLVVVIAAGVCTWVLAYAPPSARILVVAYCGLIGTMVSLGIGGVKGPSGWFTAVAAMVFFVSDVFVARWRYIAPDIINPLGCYPLYYTACTLFAWSIRLNLTNRPQTSAPELP